LPITILKGETPFMFSKGEKPGKWKCLGKMNGSGGGNILGDKKK